MAVTVDFTPAKAFNYRYRDVSELTELIPNLRYQTPEDYFETSLVVFINGQTLDRFSDNGFTVIDKNTFELKESRNPAHVLFVGYLFR